MFILDDLFARPFLFILNALHAMAIEELFDVEGLEDELKENQLLYELGERPEDEYQERKQELEEQLELAQAAREQLQGKQIQVRRR